MEPGLKLYITDIADTIQEELDRQGLLKPKEDLYMDLSFYEKYPEDRYYPTYPIEVQDKLKEAVKSLRIAAVYAQRVDHLLSGDDGLESFLQRLSEELKELD